MELLWSPWRMAYVENAEKSGGCIFCEHLQRGDDVLFRSERAFVMLNAYPYNTGHVMVAPIRHVGELSDLDPEERFELMDVTAKSSDVIAETLGAHGFNIGMNLGRVAGAGVPDHLHVHVVPRWNGDTNFMPIVGDTKVLPESLEDTAAKLEPGFARLAAP